MSAVQLYRVNETANMRRFYRVDVQPSLFGFSAVYEWGRIGRPGQVQIRLFATEDEARSACDHKLKEKQRDGYVVQ
jgi:predicted DNA-binding WGR domain protein